jgi:hypothetical protein
MEREGHNRGRGVVYLAASADATENGVDLGGRHVSDDRRRKIVVDSIGGDEV